MAKSRSNKKTKKNTFIRKQDKSKVRLALFFAVLAVVGMFWALDTYAKQIGSGRDTGNLLSNPGFENSSFATAAVNPGSMPVILICDNPKNAKKRWVLCGTQTQFNRMSRLKTAEAHGGKFVFSFRSRVNTSDVKQFTEGLSFSQTVPGMSPKCSYIASGWHKLASANQGDSFTMLMEFYDVKGNLIDQMSQSGIKSTKTWQQIQVQKNAPAKTSSVRVGVVRSVGALDTITYWDDMSLTKSC